MGVCELANSTNAQRVKNNQEKICEREHRGFA